ncbi:VWA domain-containing protein [Pectobacterium carotovorum]|uniref:VWA domain-containing protein n=1 Tax=Pectobacterium carotovorum TaxID=554 RepID=UPI000580063C|nr:VWA domain-containing protein [Pectobacterium carotovorum]KAA3667123.1 VWA domain-containing protein [Pectobacterium carotovorum subsp. carotovorum]KHT13729.1 VWA containing CoxE family protein [Pectobacterium carotovorum subsp. carotovorum]MCA6968058.1 VWA domain-containing protein [Pectobacterium carotovorum]MCL6335453.1 VWA domain-containing protein [Pectobacterium carotovorum subsp. carotovorum]MCL6348472.1 VWA domain-containing protein [Pectobacterium carotovorum subsp. carotovorum]
MSAQDPQSDDKEKNGKRWRLILGHYADEALGKAAFDAHDLKVERTLDYLYRREYQRRGLKQEGGRHGSLDQSQLTAVNWLNQARKLFPSSTFERMQSQAIQRYEISHLFNDPQALQAMEPTPALAKALLSLRGRMNEETREAVRDIIRKVVDEILRTLRPTFTNALTGRRNRFRRSPIPSSQNFDWRATIAANLKHFDREKNRLVIETPHFNSRMQRHMPWDVILCVDQSASMSSSVMYAAVCASILAALPAVRVSLIVFDTQVVDLSHLAHDPVDVLMTVQLGGGTNIAKAMQYCEQQVQNPKRTIVTLISDFEEGGALNRLLSCVQRMHSQQITLLGLAALDDAAQPVYDTAIGQKLADRGMHVAALTPEHFAQWLAEVMR